MILISISKESVVQENDTTRIYTRAGITGTLDNVVLVEIDPDNGGTFFDVTGSEKEESYFLDWQYPIEGTQTISVRVTDNATIPNVKTMTTTIEVITEVSDNLFSRDSDLIPYEPDLIGWIQEGRSSFNDKHRIAQVEILNELDANKIWKDDNTRYAATDIVDVQEFKEWSKFLTLKVIFEGISNAVDDVFSLKADKYKSMAVQSKKRATLRLDSDGDGNNSDSEITDIFSGDLTRG